MNERSSDEASGALVLAGAFARELDAPISELMACLRAADGGHGYLQRELGLADRIMGLVRGLADVAVTDGLDADAVDVHEAIELALQLTWTQVNSRACLSRQYRPLPTVRGQVSTLARAIMALLRNAAEAIPDIIPGANEIRIETDALSDGRVIIEVSDTGVGIPRGDLRRIFEPFFTTKDRVAAGLGLAAARSAIESLGGTLVAESEVGQGSRFRITLPASDTMARGLPRRLHTEVLPLRRVLVAADSLADAHALTLPIAAEETSTTYAQCDDALERLGLGERFELIVWDARSWLAGGYRERLAQLAPDALPRTFAWNAGNGAPRVEVAAE